MRLSKRSEYGIKAVIRLTVHSGRGYLQSREIASSEGLPAKFLESILLALRSARILESKVGAGGGYRLARDPSQIRVIEVIRALNTTAEDDASANPDAPGSVGLRAINRRLEEALEGAVGGLTLAQISAEMGKALSKAG
jgi:Rrf2 family protein